MGNPNRLEHLVSVDPKTARSLVEALNRSDDGTPTVGQVLSVSAPKPGSIFEVRELVRDDVDYAVRVTRSVKVLEDERWEDEQPRPGPGRPRGRRVAVEDIVGVGEVAEVLGWHQRKVSTYLTRHLAGFPDPVTRLKGTPVWDRQDILRWSKERGIKASEGGDGEST